MMRHTVSTSHQRIRQLAMTALMTALIWFLTFTPIGFTLPFFGISMTFVHIPVVIGTLTGGFGPGLVLSFMFGLASLVKNLTSPTSIYSYLFMNPLVSILPRLAIGPAICGVARLMRKVWPNAARTRWGISAIAGALTNTVCTLSVLTWVAARGWFSIPEGATVPTTLAIWSLAANTPVECLSAAVLSIAILSALRRVYKTEGGTL